MHRQQVIGFHHRIPAWNTDAGDGAGGTGGGGEGGSGGEGKPADKTFTQADVDKVVADRLIRERSKFADYADLQAKAKRLEDIEKANQTELEKAVQKAKDEGRSEAHAAANARLVNAEARALAAAAKFRNPALAAGSINLSTVKVADDGTVDSEAINALLKELAESDPYLVADDDPKATKKPKPDKSQGPRSGDKLTGKEAGLAEARRRFGTPAAAK